MSHMPPVTPSNACKARLGRARYWSLWVSLSEIHQNPNLEMGISKICLALPKHCKSGSWKLIGFPYGFPSYQRKFIMLDPASGSQWIVKFNMAPLLHELITHCCRILAAVKVLWHNNATTKTILKTVYTWFRDFVPPRSLNLFNWFIWPNHKVLPITNLVKSF